MGNKQMNLPKFSLVFVLLFIQCNIASVKEAEKKIEDRFKQTIKKSKHSQTGSILVHSDKLNLHVVSAEGFVKEENKKIATIPNQPFHIASIGKIFTTVLIFELIESGKLSEQDSIQKILGKEILKNFFVVDGKDYSEQVTILHLLTHTSGIADYFESIDKKSKSVIDEIKKEPNRFWKPIDLLDFTRNNQKAFSIPGKDFHYSDTGFILLGLIIEKLTKKSFETVLSEKIFKPIGMKNSYMHLRSEPLDGLKFPLSTMMLENLDVTNYKSISSDWSGGGIISTTEDLYLFQKALLKGKFISQNNYQSLKGKNIFMDGILYGKGLMTVKFGEMSFFMPNAPELHGHSGLLGTQLFYSPEYDAHIILNIGSTEDVGDSFELMFWIMQDLKEVQKIITANEKIKNAK
jgi:D-alanyl-D-alanine carboxypeptidase